MTAFDFGNRSFWTNDLRREVIARRLPGKPNTFAPIPPITRPVNNRVLMVGCSSRTAKPNWRLGCRASKRLLTAPNSSRFVALVHCERINCLLNVLTLVKFEHFGPYPYLLFLEVPRWITQLSVEVWSYKGPDPAFDPDVEINLMQ